MSLADLREVDENAFETFVSALIEYLKTEETETISTIVSSISNEQNIPIKKLKQITKQLLQYFSDQSENPELISFLIEQGLSEKQATFVSKKFLARNVDDDKVQKEPLMINKLLDIDWKFGITASSSEYENVGAAFFQMRLSIDNDGKVNHIPIEMNVSQFYNLLHELEKAKSCMESISKT